MPFKTIFHAAFAALLMLFQSAAESGPIRDAIQTRRAGNDASVQIERNINYGADRKQQYDVYAPKGASNAPVIFMVHGGAWRIGSKSSDDVVKEKVARWVSQGFVFISVDYRLLPETNPLEQANDVARALAHAQNHAARYGADADQFILMGHSSGGHLVSLLTANPQRARALGARNWLGTVSLDSAALDVEAIMRAPHHSLYGDAFGETQNPLWREASPAAVLAADARPMLLICSSTRKQDSCAQAHNHVKRVQAIGGRAEVQEVALNHMDINATLGADSDYTRKVEQFMASLSRDVTAKLTR